MAENRPASEHVLGKLLQNHYQGAEMDGAYRASLLAATRSVVASRRAEARGRLLTWAAAAVALPASVAASVALCVALQTALLDLPRALAQEYQARQAYELAQFVVSFGPDSELPPPAARKGNP
jgi:hypothetical protein